MAQGCFKKVGKSITLSRERKVFSVGCEHDCFNEHRLAELEKENKVFVIRPTIPEISRTEDDYNKKITYYNHGYSQMRTGFNDLQEYLNS